MAADPRFAYKNGKQVGLAWKPLAEPVARVEPKPEPTKAEVKPTKRGANLIAGDRHDPRRYDYQEIADLWSQGLTYDEITAKVGCSPVTIRTALQKIKPEGYTGVSGPRRIQTCIHGHDMAVHGRAKKEGGRMCMECKRRRDREAYLRKQERKNRV